MLAILLVVLLACGAPAPVHNSTAPATSPLMGSYSYTPSPTRTPRGTLIFSDMQFPDTVNPLFATSTVDSELDAALWGQPVFYDQQFHVHPDELTEVPLPENGDVRDGGKTIIMHLRHDLRWSDGQPIVAGDFRFWWQLDQDPNTGATSTYGYDQIASITTPDAYTVVLHMKQPFGPYLSYLPYAAPQHAWSKLHHVDLQNLSSIYQTPMVTSGPYKISHMLDNVSYTLVPNPYYTSTTFHGPFIAQLIYQAFNGATALSAAAQHNETDVTMGYLSDQLPDMSHMPANVEVLQTPAAAYEHLDFNNAEPLFQNTNVRRAIELALNICGMIQSVLQTPNCARRIDQVEPPPSLYYDASIQPTPYDPATAKKLLAQAGWLPDAQGILYNNGQPMQLRLVTTQNDPLRSAIAAWIQHDLEAVGIEVRLQTYDLGAFFGVYARQGVLALGNYDLALFTYSNSPEPDDEYSVFSSSQIPTPQDSDGGNYARINDPIIDQALTQGRNAIAFSDRLTAYHHFLEQLAAQAYILPLCTDLTVMTVDTNVHGVIPNPNQSALTWNIADWWVNG
jgi:peptide/nickel transport system substrate-binding protein